MESRAQAFLLSGFQGDPTPATATIETFTRRERWRRALAGLGKWWGIAVLSVFIPVAHFLLVPSFFLYGIAKFIGGLAGVEVTRDGRGRCPDCGEEQPLEIGPRWRAAQGITCRRCHRGLQLTPADSLPPPETLRLELR